MDSKKKMIKSRSTENHLSTSNLEQRLEEFVTKFVTEFEGKLTSYSVILDGVIPKSERTDAQRIGRILGLVLGGAAGFALGNLELGANAGMVILGKITKTIENQVGKNHHQCKLTKLSEFIYYFEQNKSEFRKMLVKVGLDIFQSFEMQFGQVTSDLGERGAMNQLAIDAMNRAIDYISRTSAESKQDHHSLILEGVISGQSKLEPVLVVQGPGTHKGFDIRFKHEKKKSLKTGSLYSKVGIAIVNKHSTEYYHPSESKCKSQKYGFRRCFTCEKWEELKPRYAKANLYKRNDKLLDYSNYFTPNIVHEKSDCMCAKLEKERDCALGIDRINCLLNESKNEILSKLQQLKPVFEKSEEESKILSNIESGLKNLKCEEYFSKFDQKMDCILSEISKGNEETICKLEKISFSLVEINHKIEHVNHVKSSAPSQNSVWFDVRNELLTFTGREAILDQMEKDLDSGPVVICGLGGIGKSELAVKYAHTRYDKADNVIWVNAETSESMTGSIWQLAQALNLSKKNNCGKEKDLDFILSEIYKLIFHQKCLLILDNAKNFSDIEPLLRWNTDVTHRHPKVIVTSRNSSEWESGRFSIKVIQIDVFDRSEAIDFVQKSLSIDNSPDIDNLIEVLGNFPLALQLAVNNIKINNANYKKRNKQFTIANFLEKFENEPQKLMGGKLPMDMYRPPYSIFVVVSYTFKALETENELGEKARYILKMASYLSPDNIKEDFFKDEIPDEDELFEVMNLLENYSLVKINEGKLNVHRLVQQAVRFDSEREAEIILRKNLILLMKRLTTWDNITFYSPHIFSIWDYACDYGNLIEEFMINSSTKFYTFSSFLETLVQNNKIKLVKKVITQIKNGSNSDYNLIDVLRNIFGEKSIYFATHHPEMVKLLKAHETPAPIRSKPPLNATISLSLASKSKKSVEPVAMRTEILKLPEMVRNPVPRPIYNSTKPF